MVDFPEEFLHCVSIPWVYYSSIQDIGQDNYSKEWEMNDVKSGNE